LLTGTREIRKYNLNVPARAKAIIYGGIFNDVLIFTNLGTYPFRITGLSALGGRLRYFTESRFLKQSLAYRRLRDR